MARASRAYARIVEFTWTKLDVKLTKKSRGSASTSDSSVSKSSYALALYAMHSTENTQYFIIFLASPEKSKSSRKTDTVENFEIMFDTFGIFT